ncbi:refilin B [Myxocyprinus asiaticus]|uniref:refilin B n=1 Tax=Myxocyprinus asiaticus TaxID=70543 RepID=UPI002221D051|nr:refilin B [Myxocyprinus asiaticus]
MVGRLNLQNVSDDDPLEMNLKADRPLDSPDSGLPPSPSPSVWLLQGTGTGTPTTEDDSREPPVVSFKSVPQLHALSYGEGIELDPLPLKEIRYTSSVRYDSDRHFIQDVTLQPKGLGLKMCSQTVLALPQSTWRHYKTQLEFQPRQRVQRYQSTTIVYPKYTRTFYTTQLNYDGHKLTKRFFSTVELQASDCRSGL